MSAPPLLQVERLSMDYRLGGRWLNALNDISLAVAPGEIHGLVGESGSGKTTLALTLLRYAASNARLTAGRVRFDGEDLFAKSDDDMRRLWGRDIALVPQDSLAALNPSYTVGEQLAEVTRRHAGLSRRAAWEKAVDDLRRVRIADAPAVARRYPHALSGGMQQRVMIAMALSTRPRLLVLDEPTTALDVTTQAVILDLVRELIHEQEAAALYVSHDLGVVARVCDTVSVLYAGEIMESGPVDAIYRRSTHPYTLALLAARPRATPVQNARLRAIPGAAPALGARPAGCPFAPRCPAALPLCTAEHPALEPSGEGRHARCHRWRELASGDLILDTAPVPQPGDSGARAETVLSGRDIRKTFGRLRLRDRLRRAPDRRARVLNGVSFDVRRRSTLGLVGESGSGKTTLARCVVGLTPMDDGTLTLLDVPLDPALARRPQEARRQLQMIFQNPNDALNPYQTVGEALDRAVRRLSAERLTGEAAQARVLALLDALRLSTDYAARFPSELSGGEKQRVALARAFAARPALVVADEPTSSLDVSVQAVILNLLKDLRAEHGVSYLFISHNLDAVAFVADRLLVMYLGEIVEEGDVEDVYAPPHHPYTEALLSARPGLDPSEAGSGIRLSGEVPSPGHLPSGCRFHTRCPRKLGPMCEREAPPWQEERPGHWIRCHIPAAELGRLQAGDPPGAGEETGDPP